VELVVIGVNCLSVQDRVLAGGLLTVLWNTLLEGGVYMRHGSQIIVSKIDMQILN
jgi:hypothetical protein